MGTLEKRHALTSLAAGAIAPAMALYPLLRPLIFSLDAERAHHLTLASLKALPTGRPLAPDPMLSIKVAGLQFPIRSAWPPASTRMPRCLPRYFGSASALPR